MKYVFNHNSRFETTAFRWLSLFDNDSPEVKTTFNNLCAMYNRPERHYHILKHIMSMLDNVERYRTYVVDFKAVSLATWFHDCIYDTHKKDNELQSSLYAGEMLGQIGVGAECISKVQQYIMATCTHEAEGDSDLMLFLDLDLAILAVPWNEYQDYFTGIRQEYQWVPLELYVKNRLDFLHGLLARKQIYSTPSLHAGWDFLARHNIQKELEHYKCLYK